MQLRSITHQLLDILVHLVAQRLTLVLPAALVILVHLVVLAVA
jgi:hypothetical protein